MKASKMRPRPSTLTLVSIYAIIATLLLSHYYVRDMLLQIQQTTNQVDEGAYYEKHFLPMESTRHHEEQYYNNSTDTDIIYSSADIPHSTKFPVKTHIVTQGKPRTATTLLFNMVAVSYFLYLVENDPAKIPDIKLIYWQRPNGYKQLKQKKGPYVVKAHIDLDNFKSKNTVVFTAAVSKEEARKMERQLTRQGHTVAFVQDMESIKEGGVTGLVDEYVTGYGLSEKDRTNLNEYFSKWEILRQCCGQQMSVRWRNDMMPEKFKIDKFGSHPKCPTYDIDAIEKAFMETELYTMINKYSSVQPLNKASLNDGYLNGTYCSSYNHLVRTQGLSIWGQPGGRPVRSKLDGAIKDQMKIGREGLKPEDYHLFPSSDEPRKARMNAMWKKPEDEKRAWLRAVLAVREGGKSWSDYKIPPTTESGDLEEDANEDIDNDDAAVEDVEGEEESDENENEADSNASTDELEESEDNIGDEISEDESSSTNGVETATHSFDDDTHAIFLISFGEEAEESTLVERCVLSLRRRGSWDGFIVLLTDASPERYQNIWDDNVIVMHPVDEHLNADDGTPLKFTRDNTSLKPKRFKTYIIDYMDMDTRLDSVELIYYLDIDIMAGDAMGQLFDEIEDKYEVSREERSEGLSKLYFFTPLSSEWPVQGGTFIVERRSSRHCLELWRKEIDALTISGRGRDQDALRTIYERIQTGEENRCELVRMENENFISFPTPRTFNGLVKQSKRSSFPGLIHISNSVFAKWIDEDTQTDYINDVLQLSEEEKQSGKYGKIVVKTKKSDM